LLKACRQQPSLSPSTASISAFPPRPPETRNFSAQAAAAPRRRRTTTDKDPILVTERAAARIQDLLANHGQSNPEKDEPLGIRLGVRRRGCNGLSYTLNYAYDPAPTKDIPMEAQGVKLWIEPMALFSIVGTTMDWEETELSSEFTFHNPNSKGECGCGESFTV
jgi:iron-sulfur cluster assembly protein